jgi:HD superfamily phosphohydrolase
MTVGRPGPPDLNKAGRIRDPVHGYVFFTGVERVILDHSIAQRLRHVAQSGMAQMVFPEVRSSRFSHSLGAMHLASQFLASSLANADADTRSGIEAIVRAEVNVLAEFGTGLSDEDLRALFRNQGPRADGCVSDNCRAAILLVEQGLRLAALFHDLGHLPFSHDFEIALDELLRRPEGVEYLRALAEEDGSSSAQSRKTRRRRPPKARPRSPQLTASTSGSTASSPGSSTWIAAITCCATPGTMASSSPPTISSESSTT